MYRIAIFIIVWLELVRNEMDISLRAIEIYNLLQRKFNLLRERLNLMSTPYYSKMNWKENNSGVSFRTQKKLFTIVLD